MNRTGSRNDTAIYGGRENPMPRSVKGDKPVENVDNSSCFSPQPAVDKRGTRRCESAPYAAFLTTHPSYIGARARPIRSYPHIHRAYYVKRILKQNNSWGIFPLDSNHVLFYNLLIKVHICPLGMIGTILVSKKREIEQWT